MLSAGQVARIEADADHLVALAAKFPADGDRVPHALERVVGVDQEDAVVGHYAGILAKGGQLVVMAHDPTVGVRAADGDAEDLAGQDVRGGVAAADVGRPAGREGAVDALGPPQAEFQHRLAAGRQHQPRGLGGDQRLEVDDVQKRGLQQLGLQQRPADPHQRLLGKDHRPFRHGIDVAGRLERAEEVEKGRLEQRPAVVSAERRQVRHVRDAKARILKVLDRRGQPCGDRVAAVKRAMPKGQMKDRFPVRRAGLPVAIGHRQLVQVGQQGQRGTVDRVETLHSLKSSEGSVVGWAE